MRTVRQLIDEWNTLKTDEGRRQAWMEQVTPEERAELERQWHNTCHTIESVNRRMLYWMETSLTPALRQVSAWIDNLPPEVKARYLEADS